MVVEPDGRAADVDILVTNRAHHTIRRLAQNPPVPLLIDTPRRGFAYYLCESGHIKPIDLYDHPELTDHCINELTHRSVPSKFHHDIKVLSPADQLAYSFHKALKKPQEKQERHNRIYATTKTVPLSYAIDAFQSLCSAQCEKGKFTSKSILLLQRYYSGTISFDEFVSHKRQINAKLHSAHILMRSVRVVDRLVNATRKRIQFFSTSSNIPVICFVGVDGSGKSTMIKHLPSSLSNIKVHATRLDSNYFFSRRFALSIYLITRLTRIPILLCQNLGFMALEGRLRACSHRSSLALTFLDTKAKLRHFHKIANTGHLVLIDRWWIDLFASKGLRRLELFKPGLLAEYLKLRQPSIIFLMTVPQEVSKQRRPEENIKKLGLKERRIKSILEKHFESEVIKISGVSDLQRNIDLSAKQFYYKWCENITTKPSIPEHPYK